VAAAAAGVDDSLEKTGAAVSFCLNTYRYARTVPFLRVYSKIDQRIK